MSLPTDRQETAARIVKRLLSKGVWGTHHKQPQTIAGWFATHERGEVKRTIDEMVSDRDVPLRRKGRGTVQLSSKQDGEEYLTDNGYEPPSKW